MGPQVEKNDCLFLCLIVCSAMMSTATSAAGELKIGGKLPRFAELVAVDGKKWKSDDFHDTGVLIVAFTCNRCLYAVDYEERLSQLHENCHKRSQRVQLFVINSNYGRDESLEKMKLRSQERQFRFPYVKDDDQSVARAFGAVYTPEFFVFDEQQKLVYTGALDDSTVAEQVTVNYVLAAVDAVMRGESVEVPEVGARGCTIRFQRRRPAGSE